MRILTSSEIIAVSGGDEATEVEPVLIQASAKKAQIDTIEMEYRYEESGGEGGGGGGLTPAGLKEMKKAAADYIDGLFNKQPYTDLDSDGDVDATDAAEYHRRKMVEEGYYTSHAAAYLQINEMADWADSVQKDGKYRETTLGDA